MFSVEKMQNQKPGRGEKKGNSQRIGKVHNSCKADNPYTDNARMY